MIMVPGLIVGITIGIGGYFLYKFLKPKKNEELD